MKIVPDAAKSWRWYSMQLLTITAGLQVAWETLPPDALAIIPEGWRGYVTLGLVLAAMVGRIIDQSTTEASE